MVLKNPACTFRAEGESITLYRDEKALTTPLGFPVAVPTQALAEKIAKEFEAVGARMDLRKMPMMQMTLTAIDMTARRREEVLSDIMRYGETELICQRATDPADLVAEQEKTWRPYLDWCQTKFGADLCTGSGIAPFKQKAESLAALRAFVETLDAFFLTGFSAACGTLGSLVLGLALLEVRANAAKAFEAAELEGLWQIRKWGEDPVSQSRHANIKRDLEACAQWFLLLRK